MSFLLNYSLHHRNAFPLHTESTYLKSAFTPYCSICELILTESLKNVTNEMPMYVCHFLVHKSDLKTLNIQIKNIQISCFLMFL